MKGSHQVNEDVTALLSESDQMSESEETGKYMGARSAEIVIVNEGGSAGPVVRRLFLVWWA